MGAEVFHANATLRFSRKERGVYCKGRCGSREGARVFHAKSAEFIAKGAKILHAKGGRFFSPKV